MDIELERVRRERLGSCGMEEGVFLFLLYYRENLFGERCFIFWDVIKFFCRIFILNFGIVFCFLLI